MGKIKLIGHWGLLFAKFPVKTKIYVIETKIAITILIGWCKMNPNN